MKINDIHNIFLDLEKEKKVPEGPYWVEVLRGDVSHRIYYRAYSESHSFILCYDQRSIGLKYEDHLFLFMQDFLKRNNINCPEVISFNIEEGWVIQEDLGSIDLLQFLGKQNKAKQYLNCYKEAVDLLSNLHFCDDKEVNRDITLSFDKEKLMNEVDMSLDYFLKKYLKINDVEYIDTVRQKFNLIVSDIAKKPMVPCHRDYHSRNIMNYKNQLYMIDFQDIRWGIPQYDLASLLHDCYFTLDQSERDHLLDYYWDKNKDQLQGFSTKEEFLYYYDLIAVQRIFKAIGSFCFIFIDFKRMNYLQYIGTAMENLKRILFKHDDLKELGKSLFGKYYAS